MKSPSEVLILKTTDRAKGVPALLSKLDIREYLGKNIALKAISIVLIRFQRQHILTR